MPTLDLTEWLSGEDIIGDTILFFVDEGENTVIPMGDDKPDKKAFEITVSLPDKNIRKWTMNVTSQRAVAQTYGKNTKDWVGKPVVVFTSEQNVQGTMRKVIYARVPAVAVPSPNVPIIEERIG